MNPRPSWSPTRSSVQYTEAEIRALNPIRTKIVGQPTAPEKYDVFLCHAWDDRKGIAKEMHEHLENLGVSVWFSEKNVVLGSSLLKEIDRGLAKSRAGAVVVTPAFLERLNSGGIADKELSVLLAQDLLVPIIHNTTYDDLRDVSPLLASRSGLNTDDDTLDDVATKIPELVSLDIF